MTGSEYDDDDHQPSSSPSPDETAHSFTSALENDKSILMRPTKINILPRTSARYSPLENGNSVKGKKINWRAAAVLGAIFIGAVWIVNPREQLRAFTSPADPSPEEGLNVPGGLTTPTHISLPKPGQEDDSVADDHLLTKSPKGPEDDPDPLKTVHCLKPYSSTSPLVQYALMLDAGSTGSRIHIYKFHNCRLAPTLEYEVFKMTQPGLSDFRNDPLAAAKSLDILMEEAVKVVPKTVQGCTKVAVKATAGLRLLGKDVSEAILSAVRQRLTSQYKFPLAGPDAVTIMDGKDEGVYAWITANYLLGTIGGASKGARPTYAVLDLGGASTQIVFEPSFAQPGGRGPSASTLEDGDHKYSLTFSGKTHTLYQHSYLGYGLMRARRSVHNLVAFMWDFRLDGTSTGPGQIGQEAATASQPAIPNPCLSKGTKRKVTLDGGKWAQGYHVTMAGEDVGSFDHCNRVVELVMAKDAVCKTKPCSFNGVYQPNILETFPSGGILALSYFYDRVSPLLPLKTPKSKPKNPGSFPISDIATIAERVCAGPDSWKAHWGPSSPFARSFGSPEDASKAAMAELEDRPEYCLDLTFMHALLRLGYEFGAERGVRVEKKVDGVELGWCLGATIALLLQPEAGEGLRCIA